MVAVAGGFLQASPGAAGKAGALLRAPCPHLAAGDEMASRFELDEQRQLDAADVEQRGWSCPFSPEPS